MLIFLCGVVVPLVRVEGTNIHDGQWSLLLGGLSTVKTLLNKDSATREKDPSLH